MANNIINPDWITETMDFYRLAEDLDEQYAQTIATLTSTQLYNGWDQLVLESHGFLTN